MGMVIDASVLETWRAYKQAEQRDRQKPRVDYTSAHVARDFYWSSDELLESTFGPEVVSVQLTGKEIEPYLLEF